MKNFSWSLKNLFVLVTAVGGAMAVVAASFQGAVWVSGLWIALVIMLLVAIVGGLLSTCCYLFGQVIQNVLVPVPNPSISTIGTPNLPTHLLNSTKPTDSELPPGSSPIDGHRDPTTQN